MSKQTEVQRLIESLEAEQEHMSVSRSEVAAELRRLEATNADLEKANDRLCEQNTTLDAACAKLEAVNAELLEFAREYLSNWGDLEGYMQDMARAAIAKHNRLPVVFQSLATY